MKKIVLSIIAVCAFGATNAQDFKSSRGENYLPENGDWAIGFNANGVFEYLGNSFNNTVNNAAPTLNNLKANTFVGKKFIADNQALRVVANLGFGSDTSTSPAGSNTKETTTSGFNLTAGLGKEWRRGKTRLQGFYGADAVISLQSNSVKNSFSDTTTGVFQNSVETKTAIGFGIGVNGFLGAEYFILPKMSLGAQYTYGINFLAGGKTEQTNQVGTAPSVTTDLGKGSSFALGNVGVASVNLTLHF